MNFILYCVISCLSENTYIDVLYVIWRRQCIPDDQTVVLLMLVTESRVTSYLIQIVTICQDGYNIMLTVSMRYNNTRLIFFYF